MKKSIAFFADTRAGEKFASNFRAAGKSVIIPGGAAQW
jgi:hypothetical protein